MDWHPRTLVRIFLLVGGLVYVGSGLLSGSLPQLALGVAAAALGAFGLWWEYREAGG